MAGAVQDIPAYHLGQVDAEALREAEKAFLSRPRVSIRLRIVAGFLLCFFLTGAGAMTSLAVLYQVRGKARFIRTVDGTLRDVLEARRLEREYFAGGEGLPAAVTRARSACERFRSETVTVVDVAGEVQAMELFRHLEAFATLLETCRDMGVTADGGAEAARLRDQLNAHGSLAAESLSTLSDREARSVERGLILAQSIPFITLGFLLVLIFWMTSLLARTITRSLQRFHDYTNRIAKGDFSAIRPAKPYYDEFSDLALATNRMLFELRSRERQVIRAGKLAAVGTFTSGIAHELITPLTNVLITAESLLDACKGEPEKHRLLEDVYREAERAADTVRGLLDFTSEDQPMREPLEVKQVLDEAARLLRTEMALQDVVLTLEADASCPLVFGNANQLRQVFLNLFLNAVQAMPQGGLLSVAARTLDGGRVCVEVADGGTGIPIEDLPHIFDPFFTTKPRGKGTGLGLATVHAIVKKHGGEIHVESILGKGTTFQVCLPAAEGFANSE